MKSGIRTQMTTPKTAERDKYPGAPGEAWEKGMQHELKLLEGSQRGSAPPGKG
jgi:hypothetical protein